MPVRRHEPVVILPRANKYATRHDYGIEDSLNRADYLSNACLEDTYEAANRSRGKDHALLRNVNAAIRPSSRSRDNTPTRTGRPTNRFRSLPPVDLKPPSSSRAVVPYNNLDRIKSALSSGPSPSSLLSTRINSYLRGSSMPPASSTASSISYKSLLPRSNPDDLRSHISYKSFLSDPSVTSPFSTRSSTKFYPGYNPPTSVSSYRSSSPYVPAITYNDDYAGSEDDDYEPETSYKRKYKIIRSPAGSRYGSGVRRVGHSTPAITYPEGSDEEEEEYYDAPDRYGTYTCARPSGTSPLKLSSYDGDYDGSYDADMAPMYDYVPFGPSRQGILELTHGEATNSPSSTHLTSSLTSVPRLSPPPASSYTSVVPSHNRYLDEPVTKPSMLDSLVSTTAARAKKVLEDSRLPDYKNASLVLSVEGSAVSEDGKNRYGFRYYPPPIPLKGSHIGIDARLLGITPKSVSPADSFLSNYLNKLRDIRTEVRDHVDRGDYARGRSVAPYRASTPSYAHRTVHMPVTIAGRAHSVPVSSYRSRLDDGQSHRVDVFPLVVSETTLPSDRKLHLPMYRAGGEGSGSPNKLTVLDKINIKVSTEQHVNPRSSVVSRRVRASTAPPAPRSVPGHHVQLQQNIQVAAPLLARQSPVKGPVLIMLAPSSSRSRRNINSNIPASKPVVLSQAEAPWYLRARGGSVPPPEPRFARATSLPPRPRKAQQVYSPPAPLPTTKLWAHRPMSLTSDVLRRARARSVEPMSSSGYYSEPTSYPAEIPSSVLWAHRPKPLRKDAVRLARARTDDRQRRATSLPRNFDRASDYYYTIPDVEQRAYQRYLYAHRGRFGPDSKPPRPSLGNFPQVYVPWKGTGPSNRSKAAIIGSRLEGDAGRKNRRPRSEFAANKLREMKREEIEEGVFARTPSTSALYASRPPLPKPTERKAIRDVDGFTKPKNLMSWQYRVESRVSPDYIIYEPSSYIRMRERVKDVQEKMDRQRQLLDRYLDSDFKIAPNPSSNLGGSSVKIPAYYAAGGDPDHMPVSDLRRRLRRTIAKSKNNPELYRD